MAGQVGGLIVRRGGKLHFIPSSVARRVVTRPAVSRVPGTELGLSLIQGRIMAVIALGPSPGNGGADLVVCDVQTDSVALSGLEVISSGVYDRSADGVLRDGQSVPELDVATEVLRFETELSSRRWRKREGTR